MANPPTVTARSEEVGSPDTTPPVVTITSPTNTSYEVTTIPLNFSASEAVEWCGYSLNGGVDVTIPNCSNTTLSSLTTNSYTLIVKARDYAGNTGSSSVNFSVIGDITPPTVTISSPTHSTYTSYSVPLSFTASEAVDLCGYSLNGGATVNLPGCNNTTITLPANGAYNLTVTARDLSGNTGSASILFGVSVTTSGWWDSAWHYSIPVTINTGTYSRKNEPVELDVNFTSLWSALGESGLSLDANSIRVVEYSATGDLIGEVVSQFDLAAGYNPATNAAGTVVWILSGTNPVNTSRYYSIYFDSSNYPKTAPAYITDLAWNGSTFILSNTTIQTTLKSVSSRSGISTLIYNGTQYTAAGGTGLYYLQSSTDVLAYDVLVNGPVKKTIRITPASNGNVSFTLYDQAEFVKAEGNITGTPLYFIMFPYLQNPNISVLSRQFHYFDDGVVRNETENGQGWLMHRPQEGWACYDGYGTYKDLCLVTNAATLASSNNLFRGATSAIIFPAWNPTVPVPIQPVSYVVMADTYQDGRDFYNKLTALISKTPGSPQKYQPPQAPQAPVVGDIPDQTITPGAMFAAISLDNFVTDLDNPLTEIAWSTSGNSVLTVLIGADHIATVSYPPNWTGSEAVAFTATDPTLLSGSDTVTFSVLQNEFTLTVNRVGNGTVTSEPAGIYCGTTCSFAFDYNASVTLSASPGTGNAFAGWSGEGCSGTGNCVVTMDATHSVTATFLPPPSVVYVDDDYTSIICSGHICGYDAFQTIQAGIDAVAAGGTVNVAAGTYAERLVVDKPLTLSGAGDGLSTIDATGFGTAGNVIDITGLTGNTKIEGFDILTGDNNNGIHASGGTDPTGRIEILNNHIIGTYAVSDYQYGVIAGYGDVRTLVISGNEISNTYSNSILVELQMGASEITGNTLNGGYPSIFFMTYDGHDVTPLQKVSGNTIDMSAAETGSDVPGIGVNPSSYYVELARRTGKYANFEISNNMITGLNDASFKGISVGENRRIWCWAVLTP